MCTVYTDKIYPTHIARRNSHILIDGAIFNSNLLRAFHQKEKKTATRFLTAGCDTHEATECNAHN
jgi:hypothetical protein